MKHKNAHNWGEMADRLLFFTNSWFPKYPNATRFQWTEKTENEDHGVGVMYLVQFAKQIWSFFKVLASPSKQTITNSETAMKRNGDVIEMKHPEEKRRKDLEATKEKKKWTVLRTVGAKGPHGKNGSRKKKIVFFNFIGNYLFSRLSSVF